MATEKKISIVTTVSKERLETMASREEEIEATTFAKSSALALIREIDTRLSRWIDFDKLVNKLADRQAGYTKESIVKGFIIEATNLSPDEKDRWSKADVQAVMAACVDDARRAIDRKFASIKALTSTAYNKAGNAKAKAKGGARGKSTNTMVDLPLAGKTDINLPVGRMTAIKELIGSLTLEELSEVEAAVKAAITAKSITIDKAVKKTA